MEPASDRDSHADRLARLENLLVAHINLVERRDAEKTNWAIFRWLVAGHVVVSVVLGIVFTEFAANEFPYVYGSVLGSVMSLAVWHGMSLRPFFERSRRTFIAIIFPAAVLAWAYDLELDGDLAYLAGQLALVFMPAIIAARFIARLFNCGIMAPGEKNVATKKLHLGSLLAFTMLVAMQILLVGFILRFLDMESKVATQAAIICVAVVSATSSLIAAGTAIISCKRTILVTVGVCAGVFAVVCVANCVFLLATSFVTGDQSLSEAGQFLSTQILPICFLTAIEIALPICTAVILWNSGHRVVCGSVNQTSITRE